VQSGVAATEEPHSRPLLYLKRRNAEPLVLDGDTHALSALEAGVLRIWKGRRAAC